MAIDPFLVEATWKSAGLTKRTAAEKVKFKKTGVSEALKAYAAVAGGGVLTNPVKQTKLKAIKTVLTKCKNDHRTNAPFVAYIVNVEKGLVREAARLTKEADAITVDTLFTNAALYKAVHALCSAALAPENLEFLKDVKANVANPALIAKYMVNNAPKEINVSSRMRAAWVDAPGDASAKTAVVQEVVILLNGDVMRKFRTSLHVDL